MANKSQKAVDPSLLAVPIGTKKNPLKESKKDNLQARKPNPCEQNDKKNVTKNKVKKEKKIENKENISKNLQRDTKVTETRNTKKQLELNFENESQEKNILNKDTSKQKSTSTQTPMQKSSSEAESNTEKETLTSNSNPLKTVSGKSSSKVDDGDDSNSIYKMIDSEIKDEITPKKQEHVISDVPSVSVFASTSRDKGKTGMEFQIKKVSYFHTALNNEICRFTSMCDIWNAYKETNANLPENAKDLIDAAVEQAILLMNKKFQQFRKLINACQNGCGEEKPVTCEDLHRFWDMVYIQVDNVNKTFNSLKELCIQNWQENHPFVQQKNAKKETNKKETVATSSLPAAAARKKFQSDALNEDTVLSEDVIASSSPMNN